MDDHRLSSPDPLDKDDFENPNIKNRDQSQCTEYDALLEQCFEVIQKTSNSEYLEVFDREFKSMLRALQVSRVSQQKLYRKCQYQKSIINCIEAKLDRHKSLADPNVIDKQKLALYEMNAKSTWTKVYEFLDEEKRYQELIEKLNRGNKELSKAVNDMDTKHIGRKAIRKVIAKRELLADQQIHILKEMDQLRQSIDEQKSLIAIENKSTMSVEEEKIKILEQMVECDKMIETNKVTNSVIKNDIKQIEKDIEEVNNKIEDKKSTLQKIINSLPFIEEKQEHLNTMKETYLVQISHINQDVEAVAPCWSTAENICIAIKSDIDSFHHKIKNDSAEISAIKSTIKSCKVWIDQKKELIEKYELDRIENENRRASYLARNSFMVQSKSKIVSERNCGLKNIDLITVGLAGFQRKLFQCKIVKDKRKILLKSFRFSDVNLKALIQEHETEIGCYENSILQIVREIDQFNIGIHDYNMKILDTLEFLKSNNSEIGELKSEINENKIRLAEQKKLYDVIRQDFAYYSKCLFESKGQTRDLNGKQKILNFLTIQLGREIRYKQMVYKDIFRERYKVEEDHKKYDIYLKTIAGHIESNLKFIEAQYAEEQQLLKTLLIADQEKVRRKIQLDDVVKERDFLISNHFRQNEKMTKVLKTLTNQSNLIQRCEKEYSNLLEEAEYQRSQIVKIFVQKRSITVQLTNNQELKTCILVLSSNLLRNRTYIQFIREDVAMPINVHRWTIMENHYYCDWRNSSYLPDSVGPEPYMYESIMRRNSLLRRVNQRTYDLQRRQTEIQAKHREYQKYCDYKSWKPAPEVHEQITIHREVLDLKKKEIKRMKCELESQEDMIASLKFDLSRINKDVSRVVEHYLELKRQKLKRNIFEAMGLKTKAIMIPVLTFTSTNSLTKNLSVPAYGQTTDRKKVHHHRKINLSVKSYKKNIPTESSGNDSDLSQRQNEPSRIPIDLDSKLSGKTVIELSNPSKYRLLRPYYLKDDFDIKLK